MKDERFELDSLNLEDLDVEELEARLELSIATPSAAPGVCTGKECDNCNNCSNCYQGGCVTECTEPTTTV